MATITIAIHIPDGTAVSASGLATAPATPGAPENPVARYWYEYLSDNGREVYGAAAAIERESGSGFTFEDIAERIGREYESAKSMHRSTGRSARRWRDDTGAEPPIRLESIDYQYDKSHDGNRTSYRLPDGVADAIEPL